MEEAAAVPIRRQFRRYLAAACDCRTLTADGRAEDVHYRRRGPAPDVDGAVLQVPPPANAAIVERSGHDGVWPAVGDGGAGGLSRRTGRRYRRRRQLSDEHSGDGHLLLREAA